jgi:hypothetical protein
MKVHEFVTEVLAWERKNRATQGSVDELLAMVKNRLLPDPNNVPTINTSWFGKTLGSH